MMIVMMRPLYFFATSVLIAASAVGCRHGDIGAVVTAPHMQSKSVSRVGWVDVSSSGFTLSLPEDMQVKDMSQADVNAMMDRAKQKHPGEQKVLNTVKRDAANGHLKLVATLKQASGTGFHNALAVLVQPNTGSKTYEELLKLNETSLEKISEPGSVIGKKVTLPCGEAIRIQSSHLRPGAATTANTSYLIIRGNQLYVFSFVSRLDDKDDWRATAQSAVESLKFDR